MNKGHLIAINTLTYFNESQYSQIQVSYMLSILLTYSDEHKYSLCPHYATKSL